MTNALNRAVVRGSLSVALLLTSPLTAAAPSASLVTVTVTVQAPPCVINGDRPIEVDFGDDVMTTRVDGYNYRQPVPYNLDCQGAASNEMTLEIQGMSAGFGLNVLGTDKANLGIAMMLSDGQQFPINKQIKFTYPNVIELVAAPVKFPGSTLKAGAFSAGAVLKVGYQ
ncbi:fimbrial protein [Serratia fonticola]|uniref:fimbrial protein n=1 Tax=Serratia fonticola TaxID=47917 RepID=UPI002177AAFC|nr:fimbrial protein [Serratia fonticola]CAI1000229.1 Minor fimbrial protein prsF precursor [Serratia fonticola]CAI1194069.1 Minor fimbrial protein prsF precursor [Serratia fonticola]CAI1966244.1 Minor fimbrial protein prsF precursor [Serratia fonticola]CAI2002029.1 Minor fimbrial protein prsF precursor [Serratia fonticola]